MWLLAHPSLLQVARNPRKPRFNHFLFETLGAMVRYTCKAQPAAGARCMRWRGATRCRRRTATPAAHALLAGADFEATLFRR